MSAQVKPPDPAEAGRAALAAAAADVDSLRRQFSRTPRPYAREGDNVQQDRILSPVQDSHDTIKGVNDESQIAEKHEEPVLRKRETWRSQVPSTGSESGTEADDERPASAGFVKALPPAVLRPHKGLKTGELNEDALLTPSQLDDAERNLAKGFFLRAALNKQQQDVEERAERDKLLKRRFAEFVRRSSEVAFMGTILIAVLCGRGVLATAWKWKRELLSHVLTIIALVLAYPFKLSIVDSQMRHTKLWHRFRVPASFDPATVLYPPLLPVLVALSVAIENEAVVLPNIVLGLSSLPQRLFPRSSRSGTINALHWLISIVPLVASENTAWPFKDSPSMPYMLKSGPPKGLTSETLVSLYPLHHALLLPLHYLTRTSLLISELHLLSAVLINLLLLASSPQTTILKACLWIGGVSILVSCAPVLEWNITLARIPRWKLRRRGHTAEERKSLVDAVSDLIDLQRAAAAFRFSAKDVDSDADETEPKKSFKQGLNGSLRVNTHKSQRSAHMPQSAIEPWQSDHNAMSDTLHSAPPLRRSTIAQLEHPMASGRQPSPQKRSRSSRLLWCLRLTPDQALRRKWIYAGYTYTAMIFIVLGPVREYIGRKSLFGTEAVGWAIGYLVGQIPPIRDIIENLHLEKWAVLSVPAGDWSSIPFRLPDSLNVLRETLGPANVRLLLIGYWAIVLLVGLLVVFSLTAYVEVDTRRKVFHGVMVAMLLPSTFIDPCYCALALALALAIFLLLEVIRAGQVPPLGNAIGRFVAPYVDGRDLRGPVVVSHIFLLIGCAVPLWFSLASMRRAGAPPWEQWEIADNKRECAMIAGVVCVGMGDAAASLIGRRYGRHKWIWVGGKSLEGSAAFAAAVTVGLIAAKAWLVMGGWNDNGRPIVTTVGPVRTLLEWCYVLFKAAFCACGASFMEAVLTGANDNVVVPVALWLLVKGVRL